MKNGWVRLGFGIISASADAALKKGCVAARARARAAQGAKMLALAFVLHTSYESTLISDKLCGGMHCGLLVFAF